MVQEAAHTAPRPQYHDMDERESHVAHLAAMGTRKTRKIQVRSGRLVPQRRTARARACRGVRTRGARVQVSRTHLAHVLRIALIGWWNIACVVVCTAPSRANTPAAVRRRAEETHLFNRVWLSSLRRGCPVVLLHPFHRGECVGRSAEFQRLLGAREPTKGVIG